MQLRPDRLCPLALPCLALLVGSPQVQAPRPFQSWVEALYQGIDCPSMEKAVTVLPCAASTTRPEHDNGEEQQGQAAADDGGGGGGGGEGGGGEEEEEGGEGRERQLQRKMTWLIAVRGQQLNATMPWLGRR